jgi:hypothetical protein
MSLYLCHILYASVYQLGWKTDESPYRISSSMYSCWNSCIISSEGLGCFRIRMGAPTKYMHISYALFPL